MNDEEQFAESLRTQVTRVAPRIDVDVTRVVPAARRRRAARAGGVTLTLALALGGGAWAATTLEPPGTTVPGGSMTMEVEPSPAPSGPPVTSSEGDRLGDSTDNLPYGPVIPPEGWRDATYFHVVTRVDGSKKGEEPEDDSPMGIERWYGEGVSFELLSFGPAMRDTVGYLVMEGNEPISFTWADIAALPTEPGALHDALLEKFEPTGVAEDAALFNAAHLITDAPAPPAVRAAGWELLTSLTPVEVEQDVQDAEGRTGSSATFEVFDRTVTVIYDVERNVPLQLEDSIGKMHSRTVFLTTEFVPLPEEVADSAIEVPDLTAMTREDVEVVCLQEHLACTFTEEESETAPEGTVISSDPAEGALVTWGAPVTIVLSAGP
ncbi:PASTA domain-containing protein [Promicromonospora kroppenstedtii]|uniref:PASTA domain-containing protein n=1 Tax=Promicromonospora kroppenstedtii TaxID=440482 RepID=A0ABW7XII8_9MICO